MNHNCRIVSVFNKSLPLSMASERNYEKQEAICLPIRQCNTALNSQAVNHHIRTVFTGGPNDT